MPEAGHEQRATSPREAGCGWARAFGGSLAAGTDESATGAAGSDPGGAVRIAAGAGGLAPQRRSTRTGHAYRGGGHRRSGNWRGRPSGSGQRFTGVKSSQRELQAEGSRRVLGRLRQWRELGGGLRELTGAIRGRTEVLRRFRAELEGRQRQERVVLGKAHSEAVREIERKEGAAYRSGMEGSEERAVVGGENERAFHRVQPSYRSVLEALGVGGADGAGPGARRRAGLREDEAGRREGQPTGGAPLACSVAQRAGARRAQTRQSGAGLWPQPLSGSAFGRTYPVASCVWNG